MRHKMLPALLTGLALVFALGGLYAGRPPRAEGAHGAITLAVEPASASVSVGGDLTLTLRVNAGDQSLDAVDAVVGYPTALLEVLDADPATGGVQITPGTTLPTIIWNQVDSTQGQIRFVAGLAPGQAPVSGSFTLATIQFRGKAAGSASVRVVGPNEAALGGQLLTVNTQDSVVTVTGTSGGATPTATTPSGGGGSGGSGGGGSPTATATPSATVTPGTGIVNTATGGSVSADGVTVTVPAGATTASTTLTVKVAASSVPSSAAPPEGALPGSTVFTLNLTDASGAAVTQFAQGLQLVVSYQDADVRLAGGDPARLRVYRYDAATATWHALPTTVDTATRTLRATTTQTSLFALMVDLPTPTNLTGPPDGIVFGLGTTLSWTNPPNTAQYQIQVLPFNLDGPAIDLIIGRADLVQAAQFPVPAPVFGQGPYIMLPGMTYTWRVRTSPVTTPLGKDDAGWSAYVSGSFRTAPPTSATIAPVSPAPTTSVASRTPTLQWANTNAAVFYYEVQLSADPEFKTDPALATASVYWNLVHGGEASPPNSWSVPGDFALEGGQTYSWRVRPRVQGDGTPVDWSESWSFRTP
ncbi:MAG: hypothetical protein HY689_08140 [Chloroflexi bacterium]|nr:hypothetical protein [Chloroflexota bacterium]